MEVLGLIIIGFIAVCILLWALGRVVFWLIVLGGLTISRIWPMKFIMNSGHDRNGEPVKVYREAVTGRYVVAHGGPWDQARVNLPPSKVSALLGAV